MTLENLTIYTSGFPPILVVVSYYSALLPLFLSVSIYYTRFLNTNLSINTTMKFSTAASVATLSVAASAASVDLYVSSDNADVNGKGLSAIHEGAAINYVMLGSSPMSLEYADGTISYDYGSYTGYFTVEGGFVGVSAADPSAVSFDSEGTLQVGGSSEGFYACMNTGDPYSYSTRSYELMYYTSDAPSGCIAVTVYDANASGSSSSSAAPASSVYSNSTVVTSTHISTETSTVCTACLSTYEGAAVAPAAGAGAALIAGLAYLL